MVAPWIVLNITTCHLLIHFSPISDPSFYVRISPFFSFSLRKCLEIPHQSILLFQMLQFPLCIAAEIVRDWNQSGILGSRCSPPLCLVKRLELLLNLLNFIGNNFSIPRDQSGHDCLHKIRQFLSKIINNFQEAYIPHQPYTLLMKA